MTKAIGCCEWRSWRQCEDLRCGALVEKMPRLLKTMQEYLHNFLNIVQAAHVSFLDEGTFDDLATPSQRGTKRLAGVDFNKVRIRRVVAAVVALGPKPLVLRSPIWREKCAKSLDRNSNPTTRGVRRTIWSRSAAKPWWNVSADPAVTAPRLMV